MLTDWLFYKGTLKDGYLPNIDESEFAPVKIPHTWNNIDGQDGCPGGKSIKETDYYKGDGWYRTRININEDDLNKRIFLRFEGANSQCEVYVNGNSAGAHKGGYTAFCVEITDYLCAGDNLIAVKVSNAAVPEIAPLQADFTFYGGLYRDVELIKKNKICFSITKNSTHGIKIATPCVTKEKAVCKIEAIVENKSDKAEKLAVTASLCGEYSETHTIFLAAGESRRTEFEFIVYSPRLWNGRKDPYLYTAAVSISKNGTELDKIGDEIGFKFFDVDIKKGFFLNGKPYPLRGVSRHQDRELLGNALTKAEHDEDFKILYELGATAVRLAHYPQAEYFYKLCDKFGIIVWAEIPFVELIGGSGSYENPDKDRKAFFECTKSQLTELIEQNINRPSIVCWGIQNEVLAQYSDVMIKFTRDLHELAKSLDPSRFTTQATNQKTAYTWASDLICWNVYPGWYGMSKNALGRFTDGMRTNRPLGISEYGAGANWRQQESNPRRVKHNGQWHPEQYQTECHEAYLKAIDKRDYLWCTFVWNLFDFASDGRNEGNRPGMNDKGLVSFDRKIKKDAYYLYQAHWSDKHMLHIAESRHTKRRGKYCDIKVFTNSERAVLYINGKCIGRKKQEANFLSGAYIWKHCRLERGNNIITARGTKGNSSLSESIAVFYDPNFPQKQIFE